MTSPDVLLAATLPLRRMIPARLLLWALLLSSCAVVPTSAAAGAPLAAFSLRSVVPGYTGRVVQLRRSSDGAVADFSPAPPSSPGGFSDLKTTTGGASLACWMGSSSAVYALTLYDQSGNSAHATLWDATNFPVKLAYGPGISGYPINSWVLDLRNAQCSASGYGFQFALPAAATSAWFQFSMTGCAVTSQSM